MSIFKRGLERIEATPDLIEGIVLETRRRKKIPNQLPLLLLGCQSPFDEEILLAGYQTRYGPLIPRTGMLDHYNCHGLTFGDRRTLITDTRAIQMIIDDDGYEQVLQQDVKAGDIILYHNQETGIIHSGIVVEKPSIDTGGTLFPLVVSKWAHYWEFVHWANRCPYYEEGPQLIYYRVTH